jgi:glutathione synthase/RimK-type ligase-like ATP-grasp enzyme
VVNGEAIDITEKKLRNDLKEKREDVSLVRSHDMGRVHAHDNLSITEASDVEALRKLGADAIRAVGLDFGAVDVLACLNSDIPRRVTKLVVCEVNSAPGIENEVTKRAYARALNKLIDEKRVK